MNMDQLLHQSELPPFIQLFIIDLTPIGRPEVFHYTPMRSEEDTPIAFGGNTYYPFPLQITGIEQNVSDSPSRPNLEIANVLPGKLFGTLTALYGDLVGAEVTYIRTFSIYLASGISSPPLTFEVRKKLSKNKVKLVFELRTPQDTDRSWLPGHQMTKREFPGLGINKGILR